MHFETCSEPSLNVVLVEPEIPPNTGNVGRLCMATGARLHLVEPLGFDLNDKQLRRAGLDYWDQIDVGVWPSFQALRSASIGESKFWFFSTKAEIPYWNASFNRGDYLVFGRETKGLPCSLLKEQKNTCVRIPMVEHARSLNLATAVGIGVYGALQKVS